MSFTFVQIEKDKNTSIKWSIAFLVFFYFLGALLLVALIKSFFVIQTDSLVNTNINFFKDILDFSTVWKSLLGAGFFGVFHWHTTVHELVPKTLRLMQARVVDEKIAQEKMFKNIVQEAIVATGSKYQTIPYIIPISAMNAFAIQDFESNTAIGITQGLLQQLNREQLEGVVAHEMAHIASGDCLSTSVTMAMFKAFDNMCDLMGLLIRSKMSWTIYGGSSSRQERKQGQSILALAVAVYLLASILKFLSMLGSLFISREREYRADAIAVRLTRNPLGLAEALYLMDRRWKGHGTAGDKMDAIYIMSPCQRNIENREDTIANLFSTHPPIKKRISILLAMAKATEKDLETAFNKAVIKESFVANKEEIKKDLQQGECPHCKVPLKNELYEGVPILACSQCRGILVLEQEALQILVKRQQTFDDRIKRLAQTIQTQYQHLKDPFGVIRLDEQSLYYCPHCFQDAPKMKRRFVNQQYLVEIDRCQTCSRIWFDADELDVLQYLYEKDRPLT